MCGDHMKFKEHVENLEERVKELEEILYGMLGIKKDDLQTESATKISNEAWHKWAEEHVREFDRTHILTEKEAKWAEEHVKEALMKNACCEKMCLPSLFSEDATCEHLIYNFNYFDNTIACRCIKLDKTISIPKERFLSLIPADFYKEEE